MRFRLHNANSGQVKRNKTAIVALSSQVDALQVDVDALSPGLIVITTGVNDTLVFQHIITSTANPNVITYTYTIVLAGQRYTTDEMLTAINAAIVTTGSVQNAITTTMVFSGGRFIIRCTADTSIFFSIQVVQGSASAAESIGFVQNRVQQGSTGGDLDLVATNVPTVATATTQVTGDYPVPTVGTLAIDDAALTAITFADAFSNDISHALDASIFNVTTAGEYTINVELRVTNGTVTHPGLYWVVCRRYKNRTTTDATGDAYRDYHLGACYYRDNNPYRNDVVLGGNARIHFESTTEQFQIIVRKSYQQNAMYIVNGVTIDNTVIIDNTVSWITIEKHDT